MGLKSVVIEEAVLRSMANNAAYLKEFKFLAALRAKQPGDSRCGGCRSNDNKRQKRVVLAIKAALAKLPAERQKQLKKMLSASEITIKYLDRRQRAQTVTF